MGSVTTKGLELHSDPLFRALAWSCFGSVVWTKGAEFYSGPVSRHSALVCGPPPLELGAPIVTSDVSGDARRDHARGHARSHPLWHPVDQRS